MDWKVFTTYGLLRSYTTPILCLLTNQASLVSCCRCMKSYSLPVDYWQATLHWSGGLGHLSSLRTKNYSLVYPINTHLPQNIENALNYRSQPAGLALLIQGVMWDTQVQNKRQISIWTYYSDFTQDKKTEKCLFDYDVSAVYIQVQKRHPADSTTTTSKQATTWSRNGSMKSRRGAG